MRKFTLIFGFLGLFGAVLGGARAQGEAPQQLVQILGSDTDARDQFGAAVSVSGNRLVVGAPYDRGAGNYRGSAYVFERYSGARESWQEVTKLKTAEAGLGEIFGSAVAISGDTIAIGSLVDDDAAQSGEAVYLYERQFDGLKSWSQIARLQPSDPTILTFFGAAVALDGDIVAIGAPDDSSTAPAAGAVYIFERLAVENRWAQTAKLTTPDASPYESFGFSVALENHVLAVGTPGDDDGQSGSVYLFHRDAHSASSWYVATKIQPDAAVQSGEAPGSVENFGWSVDLHNDILAVGSPTIAHADAVHGSAFVFERHGAQTWHQVARLAPAAGSVSSNFGSVVAVHEDLVLVGDPSDSDIARNAGAAYVFGRDQNGVDAWGGLYKIRSEASTEGDRFGQAVAVDNTVVAIGADLHDAAGTNSGMAYLFLKTEASAAAKLWIPLEIPTTTGLPVEVPILFDPEGFEVAATTFAIDYDETCLELDPSDENGDGMPDAIEVHAPPGMSARVDFHPEDPRREIDIAIFDLAPPLSVLPAGELVALNFTAVCEAFSEASTIAPVKFADEPEPSFGSTDGQSVPGRWMDGSVEILGGVRGDCNRDGHVDAGDLPACVLELFDGDGSFWVDAPGGHFNGSPIGCDANADQWIDAGDLSCKLLLIFEGSGACEPPSGDRDPTTGPALKIGRVQGRFNKPVEIPVFFKPRRKSQINTLAFSIPLDHRLHFDPADRDDDGVPDSIHLNLPSNTVVSVEYVPGPETAQLNVVIIDFLRIASYEREPMLTITVRARALPGESMLRLPVGFGDAPFPSFGSRTGRSVAGTAGKGEVSFRK